MKFIETDMEGVVLIEPKVFEDNRGFFYECYQKNNFSEHGINVDFVQDNHSRSAKGALRGLHYQAEPKTQAKFIRVIQGAVFDVVVDLRKDSKTFGQHLTFTLSAENKKMLYIPKGFAHGFCVLEEGTEFVYKVSDTYSPEHERGILWNDSDLKISWPKLDCDYLLSEKDQKHPSFKEAFGN